MVREDFRQPPAPFSEPECVFHALPFDVMMDDPFGIAAQEAITIYGRPFFHFLKRIKIPGETQVFVQSGNPPCTGKHIYFGGFQLPNRDFGDYGMNRDYNPLNP